MQEAYRADDLGSACVGCAVSHPLFSRWIVGCAKPVKGDLLCCDAYSQCSTALASPAFNFLFNRLVDNKSLL